MTRFINTNLVKAIADIAIFLEFTSEDLLNQDASIEAMEQLAMELQLMSSKDCEDFALQIKKLSKEYTDMCKVQFLENLPEALGLE